MLATGQDAQLQQEMDEPVVLHQFRVAHTLQAYMRLSGIPYTVCESAYPEYESTGALPQIRHSHHLVGWRHALRYLKTVRARSDIGLQRGPCA